MPPPPHVGQQFAAPMKPPVLVVKTQQPVLAAERRSRGEAGAHVGENGIAVAWVQPVAEHEVLANFCAGVVQHLVKGEGIRDGVWFEIPVPQAGTAGLQREREPGLLAALKFSVLLGFGDVRQDRHHAAQFAGAVGGVDGRHPQLRNACRPAVDGRQHDLVQQR